MKVQNSVWLNADKTKALPAGHAEAAFLLAGKNGEVSKADAEKYGITEAGAPGEEGAKAPKPAKAKKEPKAPKGGAK